MRASVYALLSVVLFALGSTGCTSSSHASDLGQVNRTLKEQLVERDARIVELENRIRMLRDEGAGSTSEAAMLLDERDALRSEVRSLRAAVAAGGGVPPQVADEMRAFAAANGGIATYDEATGAVRLSSDMSFGLGSANLSSTASQALPRLAEALNGPVAGQYEVRVVGHTDNVPIRKPSTKAKHPTNWHLSVHRAIAVKDALVRAGIDSKRISVAGYGAMRPVVANGKKGAQENRRVEVYLAPMTPVDESLLGPDTPNSSSNSTTAAPSSSSSSSSPLLIK